MLKFIANLFGIKPTAPTAPAPYKVETPAPKVEQFPFPVQSTEKPAKVTKVAKPKAEKKPTVKKATTRKPKTPKV